MLVYHSPGGPHKFTDSVLGRLRMYKNKGNAIGLDSPASGQGLEGSNLVVYQVTADIPFELEVVFEAAANGRRRDGKVIIYFCFYYFMYRMFIF